jgi:hypothetical protein
VIEAMTNHVTDFVLNETDRALVQMAARIVMALDPGQPREDAGGAMAQAYRDDVAEADAGADPDKLDKMTLGFSEALLLEMECVIEGRAATTFGCVVSPANRRRVIEVIGRYLQMVKTVH